MSNVDFEKNEREEIRWRALKILHAGGPWPVSEGIVQAAMSDAALRVTPTQLRKELGYLEAKGLVQIHGRDGPTWQPQLTAHGIDVVEYVAPCPTGIARPAKWF